MQGVVFVRGLLLGCVLLGSDIIVLRGLFRDGGDAEGALTGDLDWYDMLLGLLLRVVVIGGTVVIKNRYPVTVQR